MKEWQLIDFGAPLDDEGESPRIGIRSADQLREELRERQARRPAMVALISPDDERLDIGIGGPWEGIRWTELPYARTLKLALATSHCPPTAIDFESPGTCSGFRPQHLLPGGQAIEVVVHFFTERRLPEWIAWAVWNPKTNRMEAVPASAPTPAFPAFDAPSSAPPAKSS